MFKLIVVALCLIYVCHAHVEKCIPKERITRKIVLRGLDKPERFETQQRQANDELHLPIHYHVIHDGSNDIDDGTLKQQTLILNEAFEGSGIDFYTASIESVVNSVWANDCFAFDATFTPSLTINTTSSMNVYICQEIEEGSGILGYAYFPMDTTATSSINGVYLLASTLPGGDIQFYNEGDTATHEVGHFLGLYHTFQGDEDISTECTLPGDFVDDTPTCTRHVDTACPTNRNSCPGQPGFDDVQNFMDYSIDSCMDHFTSDQYDRIYTIIDAFRPLYFTNEQREDSSFDFNSAVALDRWM